MSKETYITRKYQQFFDKHGYIPKMFNVYNAQEVTNIAPPLLQHKEILQEQEWY